MEFLVKRQNPAANRALVVLKCHNSIIPSTPAFAQYPEARSPLSPSGNLERSLPALTDIVEFLERIERLHPFIQRIAIKLYSWAKSVDQIHLHQIATLLESSQLSQCEQRFLEEQKAKKISPKQQEVLNQIEAKVGVKG